MSEKLYAFLLKLYPDHFRRTYGDEALRLVRDRARDEKGFLRRSSSLAGSASGSRNIDAPRIQQGVNNANRRGTARKRRPLVSASGRTIAEPGCAVSERHIISGVALGMHHFRRTQQGIPGIVSGFAFTAVACAE